MGTRPSQERPIEEEGTFRNAGPIPAGDVPVGVRPRAAAGATRLLGLAPSVAAVGAHGPGGRASARALLPWLATLLAGRVPAVAGETIGSGRVAPTRVGLGPGAAGQGVPRATRARVLVGPAPQVVRLEGLIARGPETTIGAQEAMERRQGQVPGVVERQAGLGVRGGQARPRSAGQGTRAAVTPRSASAKSDAGIHGLTLGTPGLVTGVTTRPQDAGALTEAEVTLGHGVPTPAVLMAGPPHGVAATSPGEAITSPAPARPASPVGVAARITPGGLPAAVARMAAAATPDATAEGRGLPKAPMAVLRQEPRAATIGTELPTLVRLRPSRRPCEAPGRPTMAVPRRATHAATAATVVGLPAAPAFAVATTVVVVPTTPGRAMDVGRIQARVVGPVVDVGLGRPKVPARASPAGPRPATGPMGVTTLQGAGVGRPTEVRHPSGIDAPAVVGVGRVAPSPVGLEAGVAPRALATSAMVQPAAPLMGALGLAEAPAGLAGPARAVVGVATAAGAAAVGPPIPVGLPALARLGPPRGRRAVEAALPGAPGAMEVLPRRATPSVPVTATSEEGAATTARPGTAVALLSTDATGLRVLGPAAILPAGGAVVPTTPVLRWRSPIRQVPSAVGPPVGRLVGATRRSILVTGPGTPSEPDRPCATDLPAMAPRFLAARRVLGRPSRDTARTPKELPLGPEAATMVGTLARGRPKKGRIGAAATRPPTRTVPVRKAAGEPARYVHGLETADVHVRVRRGEPATLLSAGKVARNEVLMGRRRPTIPGQATGREAALPPHPLRPYAATDVGRPRRLVVQATAATGALPDASVTIPAVIRSRPVGTQEVPQRVPRRQGHGLAPPREVAAVRLPRQTETTATVPIG